MHEVSVFQDLKLSILMVVVEKLTRACYIQTALKTMLLTYTNKVTVCEFTILKYNKGFSHVTNMIFKNICFTPTVIITTILSKTEE